MMKNFPTLFKRAVNGKIVEYHITVEGNKFRTTSGYTDGIKKVSEWTVCQPKNVGKKNETTAEEQANLEAEAMFTKCKETGYFENVSEIDTPIYFKPMLAQKWEDYNNKIKYPIASQPKLDGIRCIARADGLWSRNGKKIVSVPHIFEELKPLFEVNPDLVLDGELYADKFANDFNAICSLVKKTKPTEEDLKESASKIEYWVYDIPSNEGGFIQRYIDSREPLRSLKMIKRVPTLILNDEEQVNQQHDLYVLSQNYEGQMLRTLDGIYENKRSKNLLKHKMFCDEEYIIKDIIEGIGNKTGMVGSFVFETKEGKTFNASPKFSWSECIDIWNNKEKYIGLDATVKYFNLTPEGIPRFPYVIKIARSQYE